MICPIRVFRPTRRPGSMPCSPRRLELIRVPSPPGPMSWSALAALKPVPADTARRDGTPCKVTLEPHGLPLAHLRQCCGLGKHRCVHRPLSWSGLESPPRPMLREPAATPRSAACSRAVPSTTPPRAVHPTCTQNAAMLAHYTE